MLFSQGGSQRWARRQIEPSVCCRHCKYVEFFVFLKSCIVLVFNEMKMILRSVVR